MDKTNAQLEDEEEATTETVLVILTIAAFIGIFFLLNSLESKAIGNPIVFLWGQAMKTTKEDDSFEAIYKPRVTTVYLSSKGLEAWEYLLANAKPKPILSRIVNDALIREANKVNKTQQKG